MVATVAGIHLGLDTHANRPAGNACPDGSFYSCSTHGLIYKSSFAGNSWATWATLGGGTPAAHAASHENGGADEIDATGLTGAGGGGGSGRPLVDPTGLSWSWLNQGVATITTQDATLLLHSPAEAADNWHFRVKSVPSKPYTVIIHMLPALWASDFSGAGVGWLQTSNNDFAISAHLHNGNLHLASSKSGTDFIVTANYVDTAPHHQYWEWVMLTDTAGGNRTISVSRDGYNWLLFHSVATDDFITPDRLVFGLEARNGTYPAGLTIDSWEEA